MGNAKRHILNVLIWAICLYVIVVLDAYYGLIGVVILLMLLAIVSIGFRIRKRRILREIAKIDDGDPRAIRLLNGRVSQLKVVEKVAKRLGWDVETEMDDAGKAGGVRLTATTKSSPPKALLQALFDAGVAQSIQP